MRGFSSPMNRSPVSPSYGAPPVLSGWGTGGDLRAVGPARRGTQQVSGRPSNQDTATNAAMGLSLAFEFAAAVALFWFAGKLVDEWLGITPWAQLVGSILGWVGGILHVYVAVQRRQG